MIFLTFFSVTTSFKNEMWTLLFCNFWYFQMKMLTILILAFVLQVKNTWLHLLKHFLLILWLFLLLIFTILLTTVVLLIILFMLFFLILLLMNRLISFYICYVEDLSCYLFFLWDEGFLIFWRILLFWLGSALGMLLDQGFHLIKLIFIIHFWIERF